jgi:hypothetical protein
VTRACHERIRHIDKNALIKSMEDVLKVQAAAGNWDADPYMHGLLNGMIMMHSMAADVAPDFKSAPAYWTSRSYIWMGHARYYIRWVFMTSVRVLISNLTHLTIDCKGMFTERPTFLNEEI